MRTTWLFSSAGLLAPALVSASNCSTTPPWKWVDTWADMPQRVEPANLPPTPFTQTDSVFYNQTLRQTLKISVAASRIRILVQNVFGSTELPITAATIAYPSDGEAGVGSIDESSLRTLTFGGANSTTIAAGDKGYTDPIDFPVMSQSIVTVSLYFKDGQSGLNITGHPGNRVTSWMGDGDLTHASNVTGANVLHWYFVTAIEAWEPSDYYTWAILGDSITDGRESTNDENNRWPDRVLARLQASPDKALNRIGLANEAAGGNAILIASDGLGPALITRYKRDAIEQPGIRWVTIFEGVNDIGVAAENNATLTSIGDQLIQAYTQIAGDCHAAGLKVSAATITPFSGSRLNYTNPYANPIREAERIRINNWIRKAATTGIFDALIDFAKVIGDPNDESELNPIYDSGDHLHPNVAGYQAMADAFPLSIFSQ